MCVSLSKNRASHDRPALRHLKWVRNLEHKLEHLIKKLSSTPTYI